MRLGSRSPESLYRQPRELFAVHLPQISPPLAPLPSAMTIAMRPKTTPSSRKTHLPPRKLLQDASVPIVLLPYSQLLSRAVPSEAHLYAPHHLKRERGLIFRLHRGFFYHPSSNDRARPALQDHRRLGEPDAYTHVVLCFFWQPLQNCRQEGGTGRKRMFLGF